MCFNDTEPYSSILPGPDSIHSTAQHRPRRHLPGNLLMLNDVLLKRRARIDSGTTTTMAMRIDDGMERRCDLVQDSEVDVWLR